MYLRIPHLPSCTGAVSSVRCLFNLATGTPALGPFQRSLRRCWAMTFAFWGAYTMPRCLHSS
jgi:hypothetical protein